MKRLYAALLALFLLLGTAQADTPHDAAQIAEALAGIWSFAGGSEVMGDGVRFFDDGTGVFLAAQEEDTFPPLHLKRSEGGQRFRWQVQRGKRLNDFYWRNELVVTQNGRSHTYGVAFEADGRVHFAEGDGGGFYIRNYESELSAYIDEKAAANRTAFDQMLADYLGGNYAVQLAEAGLLAGDVVLTRNESGWRLTTDAGEILLIATENHLYATKDFVSVWSAEDALANAVAVSIHEKENYMEAVREALALLGLDKEPAAKTLVDPVELVGVAGKFPKNQRYAVYQGPGAAYGRAANGKAAVSTNDQILCYGVWRDHLLVSYQVNKNKYRFGWVPLKDLPAGSAEQFSALPFDTYSDNGMQEYLYGVLTAFCAVTDDPLASHDALAHMPRGNSVHVLARYGDWLYVEGFVDQDLTMGFVPANQVDREHGFADNAEFVIEEGAKTYKHAEIEDAMRTVQQCVYESFPGMNLLRIRYAEAESADPTDWWQEEGLEGMMLFADINDISMYDFEIAAANVARNYEFILYREPTGAWWVGNHGYE